MDSFDCVVVSQDGSSKSEDVTLRILCPIAFVGAMIGRKGENIRRMRRETSSEIVIEALRLYLGIAPEQARLDSVEERLSAVELELGLGHSVSPHSAPPHLPPNKPEGNENHNA